MNRVCRRCVAAWALLVGSACAMPPLADPNVPATRGVIVGHVRIFAEGREVTQDCTISLKDTGPLEYSVRPDATGWVIASVEQGKVRISSVNCDARNPLGSLDFNVPGDGRTTYFGHVRLDLHPEVTRTLSQTGDQAFGASMRSAPPTVMGASIATGVGLLAMLVLADSVAAGPAKVEVEDRTYEAVAAYTARYGKSPQALVVSLAGSLFSSDPSISPSVQKAGDVVYTEASVAGVRLTWLAFSSQAQRKAVLRVQRFIRKDAPCASIKLALDGREFVVPTLSRTQRASAMFKQIVHGELDLQAIRAVASAKHVLVDVCGTAREFSALARGATINFANAYTALQAKAAVPPAAAPPVAGAAVATPAASQVAPLADAPASGSTDAAVAPVAPQASDVR